ncbi:hypothetical protein PIB30_019802 [Stylosanthes scabra]|uniref:Lipase-like C-terminal domain-containing protein n=1 Tax=Stylosanthes scabra TaxID=79078 RepID=A0ABU6Z7Y1_9FABA|nr:hypothetical protein [Stylosanthes scabra]
MIAIWVAYQHLVELIVSYFVHFLFEFYNFCLAFAGEISHALGELWQFLKPNISVGIKEETIIPHAPRESKVHDLPTIVWVHGFLGFGPFYKRRLGSLSNFSGAKKEDQRVLVPYLGSLPSVYDRARELFYYLKGGQVDYGEEHSKACGHSQFGRIYERGHYPEWDEEHPVHFVGHSAGTQVVRVLQQMLADKAFKGYGNTSEKWVLSITSLSGTINGTTRTYIDGMQPGDGRSVKPICMLQLFRIGVIIYDWLDIWMLKKHCNFGLDHFNLSWRKKGILGIWNCLIGKEGPFSSGDWILPDLTIEGCIRLNRNIRTFPNTYYMSYATKRTWKLMGFTIHSSMVKVKPLLFLRVLETAQWCYPSHLSPPYKGYRDGDWQENDGAVNTISMTHPRFPNEHPNCFLQNDSSLSHQFCIKPGIWYYKVVEGDHIPFMVNPKRAKPPFDVIYDTIFKHCRNKHLQRNK